MKNLLHLFTSDYVSALGWTLLHSLWQAALLGLVAVAGFYLLRRRSAQSRYTLGVGVLGAQILASVATYFYYLPTALERTSTTVFTNYQFTSDSAGISVPVIPLPLLLQAQLWLSAHLSELVVCWLIGVGVLLLRFAGGWFYLERLRYVSRPVRDGSWQTRFGVLVARMDIGFAVELRETARIVTPMVVGVLQPIVLVPVGLLTGLSVSQVEAILAHELAHIRRHDYLVNLVQSFVEVVYFFHPVLWWLSARIRDEREHCCDDLAMAVCDDRMSLAHALVRVAEFRAQPALVVAFAANKRQLLSRVRRVLGVAEPSNRRFAGFLPMAIVLLSLSVGASVYAFQGETTKRESIEDMNSGSDKQRRQILTEQDLGIVTDTIFEPRAEGQIKADVIYFEADSVLIMPEKYTIIYNDSLPQDFAEYHTRVIGPNGEGPVNFKESRTVTLPNGKVVQVPSGKYVYAYDDTLQKKMAESHAKIEALQAQMQPYHTEMQKLQQEMQPLHQRIGDLNLQVQKEHFAVERFQREEEKLEWKKDQMMDARQKVMEKRQTILQPRDGQAKVNAAEMEKQLAEFETQIKAKEQEITTLNDQIKQNQTQAKEAEKPINDLNAKMEEINRETEVYNRKMEEIGKKIEVIGRKIEVEARQIEKLIPPSVRGYGSTGTTIRGNATTTSDDGWGTSTKTIRGNGTTTTTTTRSRSYPATPSSPPSPVSPTSPTSFRAEPSPPSSPAPTPRPPLPPKKKYPKN